MTGSAVLELQRLESAEERDPVSRELNQAGCCWTGSWTTCPGCTITCERSF